MAYAERTEVSEERSRQQIEAMVSQIEGVDRFAYMKESNKAVIMFRHNQRVIRWLVNLPDRNSPEIKYKRGGYTRSDTEQMKRYKQSCRSLWRSLFLIIKAKLEAIERGIVSFEDEFLPYTSLPDGSTVGEWANQNIQKMIEAGTAPKLELPCGI